MRSFLYLLAGVPLQLVSAAYPSQHTVVVTATQTVVESSVASIGRRGDLEDIFDAVTDIEIPALPTNIIPGLTKILDKLIPDGKSKPTPVPSGSPDVTSSKNCAAGTFKSLDKNDCNKAEDRSKWCNGKSVDTDTHEHYSTGKTKRFTLTITNTTLDFDGEKIPSFAINGQSPGPVIEANWGDEVEIVVTNLLENNATTMHWHGIRQVGTNDQDGVPGVTECGIAPGTSRVYKWTASSYGTGWYHAHLLAQYGGGIRGPIIIHGPATAEYDYDMGSVMIDDIFDGTIFQMAWRTSHVGQVNTTNYLLNGKNKSPDLSRGEHQRWVLKKGKKHLFRIINSSGQNAYRVRFDSHKMKVIAADFMPIVPYDADWIYMQNGQRYDVIIEADQPVSSYFFRAVTQRGCPSLCLNNGLGLANGILDYEGSCDFPESDLGQFELSDFTSCLQEPVEKLVPRVKKDAGNPEEFRKSVQHMTGGDPSRIETAKGGTTFRWFLNNGHMNLTFQEPTLKTLATVPSSLTGEALPRAVVLNRTSSEEWVYFIIQNTFSVSHPLHLHGHDFSVLGSGPGIFDDSMVSNLNFANPIRRDTTLLFGTKAAPAGYTVLGFQTDNPGAWIMHCHFIWHAEGGMALQFIERPEEIEAERYYKSNEFQTECKNMAKYEGQGEHRHKEDYEPGLKRRADHLSGHAHAHRNKIGGLRALRR